MKRSVRSLVATVLTGLLLAMGLLIAPATAMAGGSSKVDNCSNHGGSKNKVVCVGTINGNGITVEIGDVRVLNNIELNVLTVKENELFLSLVNVGDVNVGNDVANGTVLIVKDVLNINVCQVKVIEVGKTNVNIAKC